jgi:hypothetical protein
MRSLRHIKQDDDWLKQEICIQFDEEQGRAGQRGYWWTLPRKAFSTAAAE